MIRKSLLNGQKEISLNGFDYEDDSLEYYEESPIISDTNWEVAVK